MVRSEHSRDEQFWSSRTFGALLIAAAVISVARHGLVGEWPTGFGGWGAATLAVAGLVFLGHSLTHRAAERQSVNQ